MRLAQALEDALRTRDADVDAARREATDAQRRCSERDAEVARLAAACGALQAGLDAAVREAEARHAIRAARWRDEAELCMSTLVDALHGAGGTNDDDGGDGDHVDDAESSERVSATTRTSAVSAAPATSASSSSVVPNGRLLATARAVVRRCRELEAETTSARASAVAFASQLAQLSAGVGGMRRLIGLFEAKTEEVDVAVAELRADVIMMEDSSSGSEDDASDGDDKARESEQAIARALAREKEASARLSAVEDELRRKHADLIALRSRAFTAEREVAAVRESVETDKAAMNERLAAEIAAIQRRMEREHRDACTALRVELQTAAEEEVRCSCTQTLTWSMYGVREKTSLSLL